ncbi:MAG TPA: TetR/AcrR family transcriptional regulator [Vineibacter sp.]|nr:TetR/AcrR family transcriptional regulator [Vineibacter sp.]
MRQALLVFWRKGYDATSVSDIEAATGVARMSLYNVFGDKDGLFQTALERYIASSRRLYERHLGNGGGLAALEALIAAHTRPQRLGESANWGCLMLNTITAAGGVNAHAHAAIEAFRRYAIGEIEAALRRAAERGEIDPARSPRDLAEFILTTLWGIKAAIRHAGTAAAAAPTARVLSAILGELRRSQPLSRNAG